MVLLAADEQVGIHVARIDGQMHFVAQPGQLALFARLCLDIIGRTNDPLLVPGLRTCSPFSLASREVVILLPDLSQHLDTADLLQFARGIRLLQSLQQMQPIGPNLLS